MKKFILILIFAVGSACSQGADSLTGIWQDNEVVAAGWSNTFLFFSDGTVKFFYNQMDMRKREVSFYGSWKVSGDVLSIEIRQRQSIEGGRLVENPEGGPGDSMLTGGLNKIKYNNPPENVEMSISKIYSDTPYAMGKYIYIDAIKFFLMSTKPEELIKQFEN
jgi:hypothetical protein